MSKVQTVQLLLPDASFILIGIALARVVFTDGDRPNRDSF